MALKTYYLDKRVLKTPSTGNSVELSPIENLLNLKEYIIAVADDSSTDFTSINVDTINESTASNKVAFPDDIKTDTIAEYTSAAGVTIDGVLIKDGLVSNPAGTIIVGSYPVGGPQSLSGAGAVNITRYNTRFTSTATGNALTLADATQVGQLKKIQYVAEAAGGDTGVLTPTTASGFTTITFNAVGDYVLLSWTPVGWAILEYSGVTVA